MISRRTFCAGGCAAGIARAQARPSILLISGWNLYNIGDVAITPGFLRLAQTHCPEARVTVLLASYPAELGTYLKGHFPDCETIPMEFKPGKALSPAFDSAFRKADLLVLNSGMTLSYGYYGLEWERYIPRMLAFMKARSLRIPFGIYGHSFDRIDPHGDVLYSDVLTSAAFVYTRDSESLKVLRAAGVRCPEMAFAPDSTFGFDLQDKQRGAEFLRRHQLEPRRFLAFVPRLDANRFRSDGQESRHAEITRELISRWVRQTGEPVALVPEVQRQIESARTMVFDLLPEDVRTKVRFQPDYWMPDEAQYVYANARLVASAEMHSVILGLAAGTPSVHPYFTQAGLKQWMMRDIGLESWLLDMDRVPAERIGDVLLSIYRDPAGSLALTRKAMDYVKGRQRDTMAVVKRAATAHFAGM